ncbi:hypothetical protein B296_00014768 [Ensete ventricosum]|uniref:Quinate/shikimate 5-dehydrogenase/glutamyl-tRNA reductase domain-containing protein n=1 Tax=Ensete ventricosum TaxID=4639 RepID=A0A426Z2C7_ENSVE|nr:hypothetical protein B296_00014768 [Ensete ventricosum]
MSNSSLAIALQLYNSTRRLIITLFFAFNLKESKMRLILLQRLRLDDRFTGKDASISPLVGKTFIVIGAGGAGKALAYGARENGAKVVIANRSYELANLIGGCALTLAELEIFHPEDGMILANTTSIGMQPNIAETPLIKQALGSYAVVFDAVDTPKVTWLLREAEEAGATVVSGMEMFLRLAIGQFELFTGLAGSFLPLTSFYSQVLRFCMYGNTVESYNNTFCFYLPLCSPREPDALCCCNN